MTVRLACETKSKVVSDPFGPFGRLSCILIQSDSSYRSGFEQNDLGHSFSFVLSLFHVCIVTITFLIS